MSKTLLGRGHPLAIVNQQREALRPSGRFRPFDAKLASAGLGVLRAAAIDVLQMNLGKMCNQTCTHCHVDAGPDRVEVMTWETMEHCIRAIDRADIPRVDLTGGAPEMNPNFRTLVERLTRDGRRVMDRCNLTILTVGAYRDLPEFLAEHRVEIVASLPCYLASNTDSQRGDGVFNASIAAIRRLNALGYGHEGTGLELNLVFNPTGASLPPDQSAAEAEFRRELRARHGVEFSHLFVITNMPINRFLESLLRTGQYEAYMERLIGAFNPRATASVMCRSMLSVGWDGQLYDCDFNQMLEMNLAPGIPRMIAEFDAGLLRDRTIATGLHCYGCTAGAGSSCGGAVAVD